MTDQIAKGDIQLGMDFESHRITGWVPHAAKRGMDPNLDVPLISHVVGNLWQGGCMDGVRLPDSFKHVFSFYQWERYQLPEGCELHEFEMYDSLEQAVDAAKDRAREIVKCLDDGPTLVHCQAGLNRSGLVTALVLMELGYTGREAIDKLRSGRCSLVLCNDTFENYVLSQD